MTTILLCDNIFQEFTNTLLNYLTKFNMTRMVYFLRFTDENFYWVVVPKKFSDLRCCESIKKYHENKTHDIAQ